MGSLLSLIFVLLCYFTNSLHTWHPIKSFGFTADSPLSNASNVIMQLHWETLIYQCNAPHSKDKNSLLSFSCNISNTSNNNIKFCNNTNYVPPKCLLAIWNDNQETIIIRSITISTNNIFDNNIDSICSVGFVSTHNLSSSLTIDLTKHNMFNRFDTVAISNLEWNCPKVKVSSIGIITKNHNGDPNANLNITLFWGYQILECIIVATEQSGHLKHFSCDNSDIKLLGNNSNYKYGAKLHYSHPYLVRIDSITIIDLYGNQFKITTFCGPFQFYYWDEPNGEAAAIPEICEDDYFITRNLYSYTFIEMATANAFLTELFLTFRKDILLSDPLLPMTALISPAEINSFGVKTAAARYGKSYDYINLMLYWNLNVYSCSLHININDKYFECNGDNINVSRSDEAAFKLVIYQNHSYDKLKYNGLMIEQVRVLDTSGYEYIIDTFCISHPEYDSVSSEQCTDFGTSGTDLYLFDRVQFGHSIQTVNNQSIYYDSMLIEFSNSLFRTPNQSQHSYVRQILEIKYFGITVTHASTFNMQITVNLYWHLMSYKCSLNIQQTNNKIYYCNSSNAIITINRCSMYGMSIDNFDINNALEFQDIVIYLDNGKYYAINTTNIELSQKMTKYIQFPNNTLDFPNSFAHNIGKIVENIKCNSGNTTISPEDDGTDAINEKLDLIIIVLIVFGIILIILICIGISCYVYFQFKRREYMKSPTRKSSKNHLDIKHKSKSKSPSDIGKNIPSFRFNYKAVIEEDDDIPGQPQQKSQSTDSSRSKKEVRIIIQRKKSQKEGVMETKLKYENELKVIKASDDIDSDSSLHIPFMNNNFEMPANNNDDEKNDVINDQKNEGDNDLHETQINSPQNVYVNSNVSGKSDSDSDDMYENSQDDVEKEQ